MDTPLGKFLFNGALKQDALSGEWSSDTGLNGAWDAKKIVDATPKP
jgi:hypothetical protein